MHPRRRPPWWPEDEPWPPAAGSWPEPPWGHQRRNGARAWAGIPPWAARRRSGLARRLGCLLVLISVALASVGALILFVVGSVLGLGGSPGAAIVTPAGAIGILAGFVGLALVVRVLRGISTPLGALGDAAARVQEGDYAVRVTQPEAGPAELRTLVSTFNAMAARLESEDATRRRLLADVSHELRTPLAVIQGNLEAVLDGVYPPDEGHLRPILDETRVLERLIDDLRTLSLADSGVLPLHREQTAPAVLLEDVTAAHRATASAAGIDLRVAAPSGLPSVDLDPVRMKQVVSNLVENAIRAMPDGGSITLTARSDDVALVMEVTDDGPGIAPHLRSTLFDRFTKSSSSRGSGLGLAIARAIVTAHGGTIDATPGPGGRGTTLQISLPLGPPASAPP